jgi:hypothetical protein
MINVIGSVETCGCGGSVEECDGSAGEYDGSS